MNNNWNESTLKAIKRKFLDQIPKLFSERIEFNDEQIMEWHQEHIIMFGGKLKKKTENDTLKWEATQHNKLVDERFDKKLLIKMTKNKKNKITFQ